MERLFTEDELAETIRETPEATALLRRKYGWPSVLIGRKHKYTVDHLDQILRAHTRGASTPATALPLISGQTASSSARTA